MKYLTLEKAVCQSLMIFFVGFPVYMQGQDILNEIVLDSDDQKPSEIVRDIGSTIHFYGITSYTDTAGKISVLPNVIVTVVDSPTDIIMFNFDNLGYYDLPLKQNNKHTVYYEYSGIYSQFLELDTYSNTNHSDKLEYLLPARIMIIPHESPKIKNFYRENPIEKIYLEPNLEIIVKDKNYSDSLIIEIKQL